MRAEERPTSALHHAVTPVLIKPPVKRASQFKFAVPEVSVCACVRARGVYTHTHTHTRARARAHTHTHTHTGAETE